MVIHLFIIDLFEHFSPVSIFYKQNFKLSNISSTVHLGRLHGLMSAFHAYNVAYTIPPPSLSLAGYSVTLLI